MSTSASILVSAAAVMEEADEVSTLVCVIAGRSPSVDGFPRLAVPLAILYVQIMTAVPSHAGKEHR